MEEALAWKRFVLPDACAAEEAFAALCRHLRAPLQRYLQSHYSASGEDAEDAVQAAFLKLSRAGKDHAWPNEYAGRAWLYQTAKTCFLDIQRGYGRLQPLSLEDYDQYKVPSAEHDFVEKLQAAIQLGELWHCADTFWLGLDTALSPATCERLLLVAQMYYQEGFSSTEIPALLGDPPGDEPEMTRERVLKWVRDPGVIRLLVYRTLCMERQRLIASLLGVEEAEVSLERLNSLWSVALVQAPEEPALGNLSCALVALILLRYRHNYPASAVLAQLPCRDWGYSTAQIQEGIAAITAWLPFAPVMAELLERLEDDHVETAKVLGEAGLWKRMAFQYWYREEIPLLDVYERIQPAAVQIDYKLNTDMLNTWLSGGQLRKMLVKYWRHRYGGACNE